MAFAEFLAMADAFEHSAALLRLIFHFAENPYFTDSDSTGQLESAEKPLFRAAASDCKVLYRKSN